MAFLMGKVNFFCLPALYKKGKGLIEQCIGWENCEIIYFKLAVFAGKTGQADDTNKHLAAILSHDAV